MGQGGRGAERSEMIGCIELEPARSAPLACRRWLEAHLVGEDRGQVDDAVLLASELVTNGVLYARSPLVVALRADDEGIRVEVGDASTALPARRRPGPMATSGRGLALLERLASRWGVEILPDGRGKTVWFEVDRSGVTARALGRQRAGAWPRPWWGRRSAARTRRAAC